MNPLIAFSAFVIATGVRSYLYGPGASSSSGPEITAESRSDKGYGDQEALPSAYSYESDRSSPGSSSSYSSSGEREASILSYSRNVKGVADATSFSTSNGISSSHNVYVVPGNPRSYDSEHGQRDPSSIAMNGHSYHTSPEGMKVSLTWNADADQGGFTEARDRLPKSLQMPVENAEAHRQASLASSSLYGRNGKSTMKEHDNARSGNSVGYDHPHQHHVHAQPETHYSTSSSNQEAQYTEGGHHNIRMVPVRHHPANEPLTVMYQSGSPQFSINEGNL